MAQPRKRVSYILPGPSEAPRLQLPPHGVSKLGVTGPILTLYTGSSDMTALDSPRRPKQPRHRLGVASLALDSSTQLVGRNAPEGILYSGGRDGLVMSWDLEIPMKKRKVKDSNNLRRRKGHWETLTGWGDDVIEEETDDGDDRPVRDGDVLGDVTTSIQKRRRAASTSGEVPFEYQWETDLPSFEAAQPTQFRQCAQAHSDWVNDILLCNLNQTVVSASSDGTVKAWNPHATIPTDPTVIGSHSDYVRCLSHCRDQNWVASGSFDRTIKLWDLGQQKSAALVTLSPPDATAPKASIYAVAADPFGRTIASGSPERVIRLWDPRTGKRTGKLVGHTDNIRAILISEDSKYLLTGSADASIKLWSLSSQRCLHTFTYHTDSVWSLHSDHPSLEVFYSGDRSGLVCRVDVEDCSDISDGECVLLCNDAAETSGPSSEGINKIAVMDDNLLWTASGTSTIKRWNIPLRRVARPAVVDVDAERGPQQSSSPNVFKRKPPIPDAPSEDSTRPSTGQGHSRRLSYVPSVQSLTSEQFREREVETKLHGLPYDTLIKLISPNDPFTPSFSSTRNRDPEVATLYSAASVMSVPRAASRAAAQHVFQQPSSMSITSPLHTSRTEDTIMLNTARSQFEDRELAADAVPYCSEPDFVIEGDHGLVRSIILNDRIHALTVDTSGEVGVWDIVRGVCLGRYLREDVASASHAGSSVGGTDERDKERSPRESLEVVRERIEGEAVVSTWCMADTKAGVLTIHLTERCFDAEVYADEVGFANDRHFTDESKLNIGKWVLRNLFIGFIREQVRRNQSQDGQLQPSLSRTSSREANEQQKHSANGRRLSSSPEYPRKPVKPVVNNSTVVCAPNMVHALAPPVTSLPRASPLITPLIPIHSNLGVSLLPSIPQSPSATDTATPTPAPLQTRTRSGTTDGSFPSSATATPNTGKDDYFSTTRARQTSLATTSLGSVVPQSPAPEEPSAATPKEKEPQTPMTPGGGFIGRLKNWKTKRPVSDTPNSAAALLTPTAETATLVETPVEVKKTPLQTLLSGTLNPPNSSEAPLHLFPPTTTVIISEEASPSYTTLYRGIVSNTHAQAEVEKLEETMPMWLVEYLLLGELPGGGQQAAQQPKVSFVLMPWNKDPDVEPLPELLNTQQSKLTASRYLRIRKIVNHVQDKIERMSSSSRAASIRSSVEGTISNGHSANPNRPRAEDVYEILCNDILLPLGMSLAVVRQYVWKQSAELVMHYRKKKHLIGHASPSRNIGNPGGYAR